MRAALRRLRPELAVSPALAATVFLFACGSSSVARLGEAGHSGRWVALFVLLALALLRAAAGGGRPERVAALGAPAALLVGLALVSTLWSVNPHLTLGRAVALGAVVAVAGLLALSETLVRRVVVGLVGGAAAVALAGLVLYGVSPSEALHEQGKLVGRFQGIGLSPNTLPMLYAVVLGLSVLAVRWARRPPLRLAACAAVFLVGGSLVASGSRGAEVGGLLGLVLVALAFDRPGRLRIALAASTFAAASVGLGLAQVASGTRSTPAHPAAPAPPTPYTALDPGALDAELGNGSSEIRSLFGSSGRGEAWSGALRLADARPALGYGFGTEDRVFVDRYAAFQGDYVENSWLGLYLQLGAVGVALFLALWVGAGRLLLRAARDRRVGETAAGFAAALAAALPLTLVESWPYSAGNVATLPFWIAVLGLSAAFFPRRVGGEATAAAAPERRAVRALA